MDLKALLNVPDQERDFQWEEKFFKAFTESNVKVLSQDPQTGPDGWPYLLVETSPDATEPAQKVIQWLSTKGLGLVVNPTKTYPDYVFSFGMLWHFRKTGRFLVPAGNQPNGSTEMNLKDIKYGTPNPEYFPDAARQVLREFFRDQGVHAVKILMLSQDGINYDIGFSLESLGNPPDEEHEGVAEAISWFLPPHYSIILVSEEGLPPFVDL